MDQRAPLPSFDQPAIHWNAAIPARIREAMRLHQNRGSLSPAFMAPGMTSMTALPTISTVVIDRVSESLPTQALEAC